MATKNKTLSMHDIVRNGVRPDRAAADMRVVHVSHGGFTGWKKRKVEMVQTPMSKGAKARTIRIHEMLHANRSPTTHNRKFPAIANNAIEDARVHSVYWPNSMPKRANRDCLATALIDMRTIPPMAEMQSAEDWNLRLLHALRCMSIIYRFGKDKDKQRLHARITNAFGPIVLEKMADEILPKVRTRKTQALREFTALMRSDDDDKRGGNKGKGSTGKKTNAPMRIVRLQMPDSCNSAIRRTALARSGARINRARLANAVATGSTVGLFIRPRYLPGGTYLFDASGSMNLDEDRLNELCRKVPAARVAYYSGQGSEPDADGCYGDLVIYADNGRRATYCDNMHGGNNVDLFAIQWLLQQPAPRVFVSDGGFCGGPDGQDSQAAALLASAVANGEVEWLQSIYGFKRALKDPVNCFAIRNRR